MDNDELEPNDAYRYESPEATLEINSAAHDIFHRLVAKANGGTKVTSLAAPPLSTSFVKSPHGNLARANQPGALAEIIFPSDAEVRKRLIRKHGRDDMFGYISTARAAAFPAGYGERASKALEREDNVAQLKGSFPTAVLAFTKLRARVEARNGDVDAINRVFARMWGLTEEQVELLPHLHVAGSESKRMAAMEDRAYHALSGHPAYAGGFRVDMATLMPDALGEETPLNWQRVRTSLKAIATAQVQADVEMTEIRDHLPPTHDVKLHMDIVEGSQPRYERPVAWECIVDEVFQTKDLAAYGVRKEPTDVGGMFAQSFDSALYARSIKEISDQFTISIDATASMVKENALSTLSKTIEVIRIHDSDRAVVEIDKLDEHGEFVASEVTKTFDIPRYKLTRSSLREGVTRTRIGSDNLPDIKSHGPGQRALNWSEFRESGLTHALNIQGALNMAVYITVSRLSMATIGYKLLTLVRDPGPRGMGKVSERLRNKKLFVRDDVQTLGPALFGDAFISVLETLVNNITVRDLQTEVGLKRAIWEYLRARTGPSKPCPVVGGYRDLIEYLWTAEEGWSLYYWARISMGKLHHAVSSDILAPIAAGVEIDFLSLVKKSMRERSTRWAMFYKSQYDSTLVVLEKRRKDLKMEADPRRKQENDSVIVNEAKRYVPPHLRKQAQLESVYEDDRENRHTVDVLKGEYTRLVKAQAKSKFFKNLQIVSFGRSISIGVTDELRRETLIEHYQARWYSVDKRLRRAIKKHGFWMYAGRCLTEHPWGPLISEFPQSVEEVESVLGELVTWLWTVEPGVMWMSIMKSMEELWDDIGNEIEKVRLYVEETADCLADEQAEAIAASRVDDVIRATTGVPAIVLPVEGYRAPYSLPEKSITVLKDEIPTSVDYSPSNYLDPSEAPDTATPSLYGSLGDLEDCDEEDITLLLPVLTPVAEHQELDIQTSRFLTYNEIWELLGMEQATDSQKRTAFGLSYTTDLADQHMDSIIGPVLMFEEKARTARVWSHKMDGMLRRLGRAVREPVLDDM